MRSWLKRLAVIGFALLTIVVIVGAVSFRLLRGTPQWYRRSTATLAQKEQSARSAFNKFAGLVNAASAIRGNHSASQTSQSSQTVVPQLPQTIEVSFTDDELNAFFEKWSNFEDWKNNYEEYIDNPIISLRAGRVLLAGRVKDLDTVVTVEFDPTIDTDGQLNLRLTRILGGRLSLPEAIALPYFNRITNALRLRLPAWRAASKILPDGGANEPLICASLSRLLIHTLHREPTDAVLFLPVIENHANVPVRIVAVDVKDHVLTMTVTPLDADGRNSLLQRIKANDATIDPTLNPPANLAMGR